jgi:anti-sigma B factor antagonist
MDITKTPSDTGLTVALSGKLDTQTAPELEDSLKGDLDGVTNLVFDLSDLEYISSAGLRVVLSTYKQVTRQGTMTIKNVTPDVMDVFDMTGFTDLLNIEK